MLDESLNQFKLDSTLTLQTSFQHYFYAFNNVERPVQTPPTFGSTKCVTSVERTLKQKLKPAFLHKSKFSSADFSMHSFVVVVQV